MFIFLTCIRHPNSSKNYTHIEALFEHTARSVCAQLEGDFRLIVVCNKKPDIEFNDPRIIYLEVDFIIPSSRSDVLYDRGIKRLVGLLYAKNNYPVDYYMMLDADDLVSNTLVLDIVAAEESKGGWWLEKGYLYDFNNHRIQRKAGMNNYCGSTLIFKSEALYKLSNIDFTQYSFMDTYEKLKSAGSGEFICEILGHHVIAKEYFKNKNYELAPFGKLSVAWVINNGENESRTVGKLSGLNLNKSWCNEFSVPSYANEKNSLNDIFYEYILYVKSIISSFSKNQRKSHS
ncbi:glycosyltransferase family A protein [Paraglaciecola sp.]|uniref:glycosyltransferase family A protein n=1 Tax=Paraglaciecola sp. TaxID=1920173 RepID=UPI00273EEB9B|nr:glycosyltransferase family A protein [Paraglaciecola sp.]MDP5030985.1 glycosyltransferase family 2 protein [Paraglaciecola sp.]